MDDNIIFREGNTFHFEGDEKIFQSLVSIAKSIDKKVQINSAKYDHGYTLNNCHLNKSIVNVLIEKPLEMEMKNG